MTTVNYYKVGGCVRDEILGVQSKDIDYAVETPSYDAMKADILARGGKIFLEKPEYQTIRAKFGKDDADFVMCRRDGAYSDGRRPDEVFPGTIDDDLARRDFTMNAIAQRMDGTLYDPHGGQLHLAARIIQTVGDPYERFSEDSLRLLRAMRFAITKKFFLAPEVMDCLQDRQLLELLRNVSKDRIRDELTKCFRFDTRATMFFFQQYPALWSEVFMDETLWLEPTHKQR